MSLFFALVVLLFDRFLILLNYYIPFTIVSGLVVFWLIVKPINWTKDLTEVGYEGADKRRRYRIMKNRKLGKLPPVYPNGWFMILESHQLKDSSVKYVSALGENFAVFRNSEGKCYVLDAYCPHNGANMAVGGKVVGDCLECPFHHWQFNGTDGRCSKVPYAKKVPSFAQVKRWICSEVNGFIFVWYHSENEEPTWNLTSNEEVLDKRFKYHGRNEFIFSCHIQEVPENGGDLSHFEAIHKEAMFDGSDLNHKNNGWFRHVKHIWSADWQPCKEEGSKHIGLCKLSHQMILFNKFVISQCNVDIQQIGPGYVQLTINTEFGPMILLQTVTPLEPLLQRVVHRIYCPPALSMYATFILIGESIMIERDIMVWNHKKYEYNPLLVSEDHTLLMHRRWFSQFYTENSPKFKYAHSDDAW